MIEISFARSRLFVSAVLAVIALAGCGVADSGLQISPEAATATHEAMRAYIRSNRAATQSAIAQPGAQAVATQRPTATQVSTTTTTVADAAPAAPTETDELLRMYPTTD